MASLIVLGLFVLLSLNSVFCDSCGGLLEGDRGRFSLPSASNQQQPEIPSSSCLWIIQLRYGSNVRFTLDAIGEDSHLNLYFEEQLTSCSASNFTKLNSTQVGSSIEFIGNSLVVILPNSSASVGFSWNFVQDNNCLVKTKTSNYVSSSRGLLEWEQLEKEERLTWAITPTAPSGIQWTLDAVTTCDESDSCACSYFAILELTSEGVLREALKTCGQSSVGRLEGISERVLVLIKANTKDDANKIAVSWGTDTPQPPIPTETILFAATEAGLIALNLQTSEAIALTSEYACAVAVSHNLKKVYWSESRGNSTIMRSNFDGSAKEVVVSPKGGYIYMLAIDEASGNVYYGLWDSLELTVCNSLGESCAAIISNSSLLKYPVGIAFDYESRLMYWSNSRVPGALVRANMDGSNAKLISTEFQTLYGITLQQPSNGILYWVDYSADTIGTIDVSSGNKRILLELEGNPGPWGIAVDAQKIYIANTRTRTVQTVDRDSGEELTTIFNLSGDVIGLALFNA